jgi:hypothetical protein
MSVLGPGLKNWALQKFPFVLHHAPDRWRLNFVKGHLGPAGAWWVRERVDGKVPIHLRCRVLEAKVVDGRVSLRVDEEGKGERQIATDRVVAGVGFEPDVDRLTFIDPALRQRLRRLEGAPALDRHFQSTVPDLYFVGPLSAPSFGPLFRFVAGADYAAPCVARRLARARNLRTSAPAAARSSAAV